MLSKNKVRKIIKIFYYFKNPLVIIDFLRGKLVKGKLVEAKPRWGSAFQVARAGDYWLLEKIINNKKVDVYSVAGKNYIIENGITLRQGTSDTFVFKEIFIDECYKDKNNSLNKESVVIDIGAHIGLFDIYCTNKCGQIYAYEPHPENFELLEKNIKNTKLENVKIFNLAVWSEAGKDIAMADNGSGDTAEFSVSMGGEKLSGKNHILKTTTIEEIFARNNIEHCDLLKIDVEGAEYNILFSAPEHIYKRIKSIYIEYHPDIERKYFSRDLIKFLSDKGYKIKVDEIKKDYGLIYAEKGNSSIKIGQPQEEKEIKKLIFVVGCLRSGTTLLQRLLLNIPKSFSMPETHFFEVLPDNQFITTRSLPGFGKYKYPDMLKTKTISRIIVSMKKSANLSISPELETELTSEEKKIGAKELFFKLLNLYNKSGDEILIEKTPNHIFHVPYIKSLFPDSIIINIVRDPRDAYASYLKFLEKQNKPKRTVAEFSYLWNKSIELALSSNLPTVRYRDLIKDPKNILNGILNNFGLIIDEIKNNDNFYSTIVNHNETWKDNIKVGVITDNIGKYIKQLSKREIAEIEKRCGKNMEIFGYQPDMKGRYNIIFYLVNSIRWFAVKIGIYKKIFIENIMLIKK